MDLGLKNKLALVTASTGGIGLATASVLAGEGARVIVNGRTKERVQQAMDEIRRDHPKAELLPLVADNGTAGGCDTTIAAHHEVDILVNNLGTYEAVPFFEETDESWQRLFDVNIMSGVRLSRHYLKRMLQHGHGRIIFVSSESAINVAPEMAHYSATKLMQLAVSRSLAELTQKTAVTVNTVMPGPTMTESVRKFIKSVFPDLSQEEAEAKFIGANRPTSLLQRFIRPREIGDMIAFIASDLASAINGAAIRVDGGVVKSAV